MASPEALAIDLIAVSHTHHQHPKPFIFYRCNDSVLTHAVAPVFAQFPGQRHAQTPRVVQWRDTLVQVFQNPAC
ncbi:hypothetical protein THITH_05585 [Thioalkalivibrio paradoxus ARh 1]|uniref:Uncharacterized protein n=1 Tax=Thioalkalivibrio paradoxus ARh 1 TaxID=713585 RepID=W0DN17_9GAMM|nr:hypothetical protein THITH_05585 [Thioalkalivibrio paradoxus ARh 1]